jgi:hypothetical protein
LLALLHGFAEQGLIVFDPEIDVRPEKAVRVIVTAVQLFPAAPLPLQVYVPETGTSKPAPLASFTIPVRNDVPGPAGKAKAMLSRKAPASVAPDVSPVATYEYSPTASSLSHSVI